MALSQISSIWTHSGAIRLLNKENFFGQLAKQEVDSGAVYYADRNGKRQLINLSDEITVSSTLDHYHHALSNKPAVQLVHELQNALFSKSLNIQFTKNLVDKKVDIFCQDLTIDIVQKLAEKMFVQNHCGNMLGLTVYLSPYQRFFLVIPDDMFKVFYRPTVSFERADMAATEFRVCAKLVNINPNVEWAMCQFDNYQIYEDNFNRYMNHE